ncbi:MAG: Clp1/GlmU family protein [Candidatus Bathyarchaeia archaeon]|jgi:polynucleotide 5'-hydroxyl-kinase GRC3/NOL9
MNKTVEKGKTLLVDGPASVIVTSGSVEVFGSKTSTTNRIVIREGKRLPFAVNETASFDISLAEKASVDEVEGNTVPSTWAAAYENLAQLQVKPTTAIVLGTVDSGKTSFCTYLINRLLSQKKKIGVLDGDLGQSDIGPPCTVSYTFVTKPITDLFSLQAKNAIFIGTTSPNGAGEKVIESLAQLKKEILNSDPDFVIVNTDGWIEGEQAVRYKTQLVEKINPETVFSVQQKDEMSPLMNSLEKFRRIAVESPPVASQRSGESRKNLRELGYTKYLRNSKVQSVPLGWLKIEDDELFGLSRTHQNQGLARKIYELLGMKPLHFSEQTDRISIIIGKRRWINAENLKKIEEATKKKVVVIRKGEEEGLVTALHNGERKFLGIGIIQEIEYLRKTLKILTPVSQDIAIAVIGRVKLDKNMKEIPFIGEENQEYKAFSKLL